MTRADWLLRYAWAPAAGLWLATMAGLWAAPLAGVPGTGRVDLVLVAALPTIAALVAARRPRNPVGWLMLAASVAMLCLGSLTEFAEDAARRGAATDVHRWLAWLSTLSVAGPALLATHLPLRFPDGKLPSPRWRPVAAAASVGIGLLLVGLLLAPGRLWDKPDSALDNPLGLTGFPQVRYAAVAGYGLLLAAAAASLASLVLRWRRSGERVRRQLAWPLAGIAALVASPLLFFVPGLPEARVEQFHVFVVFVVIPAGIAVAVLRHGALDIDALIRRSLGYGILWLAIGALYVAVAAAAGVAAGTHLPVGIAVLLTIAVTLVFAPARRWVQRTADRWLFGPRPSGEELLAGYGTTLTGAADPESVAGQLAATVQRGLRLQWVEVEVAAGPVRATGETGRRDGEPAALTVPIVHAGRRLGEIRCGQPEDGIFGRGDAGLLGALAAQTGLGLHNAELATRLVEAQEAERRRIERNIHDGAQQQLVALIAQLGVARQRLSGPAAEQVLTPLQDSARSILDDLRALARGIHPAVLADGGLVEAISQRCDNLPIEVDLTADPALSGVCLTDELEGAGYFVVTEALANVLKHANARRAQVGLARRDGHLEVEVRDDGAGFAPAESAGAGLTALRDRVSALGGTLTVDSRPGGGTRLAARLPLRTRTEVPGA